jgi:hypothetical protein
LPAWAIPENWRKGMRPLGKNGNGKVSMSESAGARTNGRSNGNAQAAAPQVQPNNGNGATGHRRSNGTSTGISVSGNGHAANGNAEGGSNGPNGGLDACILRMEKAVGTGFYRNILREHGRVNQPKLIRDIAVKQKVLRVLESAARGFNRLEAVTHRLDPNTVSGLLAKLQSPPVNQIADMKTLEQVVFGLEELAGPNHHHAA